MPDYMTEITQLVQTPGNEMNSILFAGGKMLACALGSLVSAVFVSILTARIATDFGADLRTKLYYKVLSFSKAEINKFSTPSLITRTTNDIMQVYRIEDAAGIETKGLHAFRHTFATKLINGTKCADGSIKTLNIKAVADILGHTTTEITERYYVKKDTSRLTGITDGFEI